MVKQGYKQTDVGIIPEDWTVDIFKNVGDFFKGSGISMRDVKQTGFPCIMYGDIYVKFDTHFDKCDFKIDEATASRSIKARCNDLFFTASGETAEDIGKCVSYQGKQDIYIGGDIIAIRPKDKYDSLFLAFVQNSTPLIKQKASLAQGHTVVHINKDNIASLVFAHPLFDEQKRIAEALSDVDSMISSLEKLIAKKKAVKQGTMQELLTGKKRLPGFTGEWVEKKISEYGNFVSGNGFPLKYQGNPSGLYPFYKVSDFNNDGNDREMIKANNYISENIAIALSCNIIPQYSIVFAKIGAAIALERKRITSCECCIDNNMMSFQPYKKEVANYMCYLFQTIRFGELVEATALPSLSGKTIGEIKNMFPPTAEEQIAIATILSDMDNEIEALEQKLAKTRQIKQGMMQQLLTGKIRFTGKDEGIPRKRTIHSANIYFKRAVLAAEIASRLHQESTFGHVKMEKLLFLTEKLCGIDLNSNYHRGAAGPYDNRALRSIDSQLKKQKWFDVVTIDRARRYIPMEKSGKHSKYFKHYYNHILQTFNFIISTFQKMNTEQCEIVATLYSAWEDFLLDGCVPSDSMIVEEVLNNWHNSKKRISQERWMSALNWMRQKNIIPKQRGST